MLYTENLEAELKTVLENLELKERKTNYRMVISKEVKDRDWEIISIDWLDLKNYKKNPVVLLDHSYKVENIVWKTIKLKKEWKELIADFVFVDTENGQLAEKLYEAWLLKASSIWFIVKERNTNDFTQITKSELLEWSLVAVPANAEALSLDWKLYEDAKTKGFIIEETKEEKQKEETKTKTKTEMEEIKIELAEIKSILKTLVDDKTEKEEVEKEAKEVLEKKQTLQTIDRDLSSILRNMKNLI